MSTDADSVGHVTPPTFTNGWARGRHRE